jgi:parallel beta-helix repeat protein
MAHLLLMLSKQLLQAVKSTVLFAAMLSTMTLLGGCGPSSTTPSDETASVADESIETKTRKRTLYVSQTEGRAGNTGLSETSPLPDIQSALDLTRPGDAVLVKNGIYSRPDQPESDVVQINRSGTARSPITLAAYPGHKPKILSANWVGIRVQASHIIVDGFTLEGNLDSLTLAGARARMNDPNPQYGGSGIAIAPPYDKPLIRPHHVTIRNNVISKFPGGGIFSSSADYVTIEANKVSSNAYYSPFNNSGISIYQSWNSDRSTDYKIVVKNNTVTDTRNLVPFIYSDADPSKRIVTDGNGIIIDDSRQTQNFSSNNPNYKDAYIGRTLVENNVVFNNGARGIHVYSSDHVDIVNNTTSGNSFQKETPEGEISAVEASDIRVFNNIILPINGRKGIFAYAANAFTAVNNLIFGGDAPDIDQSRNMLGRAPKLVNPAAFDFRPAVDSPAIDAGDKSLAAQKDFLGQKRPLGAGIDIGAYEVK